ncbi:MAG: MFS transporter [Deltaproteobacteria bacterium]|nr:MFS transporter [Deltaproteobacteria bacterium]
MSVATAKSALERFTNIREDELAAALWAALYFFVLLGSNYLLRPLRETMGVRGLEKMPLMYTGTLVFTLLANPAVALLVRRFPRRAFIPYVYRFFQLNLLILYAAFMLLSKERQTALPYVLFIWVSVYNYIIISVFWGFLVDLFSHEQGRRLFPMIGAGGTIGGIAASTFTSSLVERIGPFNLLLICILLLEVAIFCVGRLARRYRLPTEHADVSDSPVPEMAVPASAGLALAATTSSAKSISAGGVGAPVTVTWYTGLVRTVRSPYLLGICGFLLLMAITSTFLYFQQTQIVKDAITSDAERTAYFARIDKYVNVATLLAQVLLAGRLITWFGVGLTMLVLPVVSAVGFWSLAATPTLGLTVAQNLTLLLVVQTVRRSSDYAIARPAREVLFTVVPRADKYVAKNFIDTFVYRLGDQIGAWTAASGWMKSMATNLPGLGGLILVICGVWSVICLWLGRAQRRREVASDPAAALQIANPTRLP